MKKLLLPLLLFPLLVSSQKEDSLMVRKIYDEILINGECYENLRSLCKDVGARLSGSPEAEKAVKWGEALLNSYNFDKVWLQEVMVPKWKRGEKEVCTINSISVIALDICALGGSIGTNGTIKAEVIAVNSFEELEALGEQGVKGKIVFFNTPMDQKHIRTFNAYGGCYPYRSKGPSEAAKLGAVATVLRSLSTITDEHPHTGVMRYEEGIPKIPAAAISTKSADELVKQLKTSPSLTLELSMNCETLPDVKSYNVIAEITGSETPDNYIIVGGHLDSWDLGEGAHDDGAGIVHSIEALRTLKAIGYKPKNTIRVVLFMNEENGAKGAKKYAEQAKANNENHIAAIESDRGGFTPRGFSIDGTKEQYQNLLKWSDLLEDYDLEYLVEGFGGVDIAPLKNGKTALIGFVPDSQRYFDLHHSTNDVFEMVHERELKLGAASITTLIYLIDKYGI
ncbi:MAG: M20/M25/M40 family metallo-hydrolase [Flavobacteriales bacterium]|nr:M20/M25/M40 family metallo-hydrolase [Flavobacteriales bacterium]